MSADAHSPVSLMPYEAWSEEAMREVVLRALEHTARHGLPGEHHMYITFRTDWPGVTVPRHLKARYPKEMTIVLQHSFSALKVDRDAGIFSVVLSFGGAASTVVVPFPAVVSYADPYVRFGLRFESTIRAETQPSPDGGAREAGRGAPLLGKQEGAAPAATGQVVQLAAFRRPSEQETGAAEDTVPEPAGPRG